MTDADRFEQWVRWINEIYDGVQNVLLRRRVFREVQEITTRNPELVERRSIFFDWMGSTYAAAQVMGVRRQVDTHAKSISLLKLLRDIGGHAKAMTRERHVALYVELGATVGDASFDGFAGAGAPYLERRGTQLDIDRLLDHTDGLERFASMRVAHHDPQEPRVPTFPELDQALDVLDDLVRKYALLLLARGGDIVPELPPDWRAIFRVPWER